ncbi:Rrf2 family transcriptional regulator [Neorhizobium galegae]|uniref:Rrf2 family transcriptional regulator n=1 Tax=Neorhizobium galegae TaxID=399 RepID=UPI001AE37D49
MTGAPSLTQLGWLASHRGRGGGLTLAEGAETLPLGMIVHTLQLPIRNVLHHIAPSTSSLQEAEQSRLACLDRYTLDDLASGRAENCRHERDESLSASRDRITSSATKAQLPHKEIRSSNRLAPASRMG